MPQQKTAFIIDGDRDFALKIAAALRTDGLKVGLSEADRDPLDEMRLERADVVIVRAEGKNNESGFSICNRLKKSRRWAQTPVVLYGPDEQKGGLEKHKQQGSPADGYMMMPSAPPFPFDELRDQVKGILFPADGVSKPPPLPPPREDVKPVTEEDNAFIEKVMDSLVGSEDEVSSRPPVKREATQVGRRTTADHKLDMLRQKLRQRENELAKVMEMYRAKEREYHEWHQKLMERDVEVESLRATIEDLSSNHAIAKEELDRRTSEFNASFEQLLEEKVNRENELIQIVAGKEKDLADLQGKLSRAEADAAAAKKAFEAQIEGLEKDLGEVRGKVDELETTVGDREQAIEGLEKDLEEARNQIASFEATLAEQVDALAEKDAGHLKLQALILELRADLAATRDEIDEMARNQAFELAARDDLIEGLRADLTTSEANAAQLEADLTDELEQTRAELETESVAHAEHAAKAQSLDEALNTLRAESSDKEAGLLADIARLTDAEASVQATLEAVRGELEDLEQDKAALEASAAATKAELEGEVADRDARIEELAGKLAAEESGHQSTRDELAREVERLEGERMSAEQAAADQAEQLQETIAAREATIEDRQGEIARLEGELEDLRGQLSAANDDLAGLRNELQGAQDRIQSLEAQAADDRASFDAEAAELTAQLTRTREEAEGLESDLRGQIISLGADLASRGDRVDALEHELDIERRERANADKHGAEVEQALADTKAELSSTTESLRQTERDLGAVRETLAATEGRLTEVQEKLRAEITAKETVEASLSEVRATADQRGAEIGRLEGRVAVLEDNSAKLDAEYAALEDSLDNTKEELAAKKSDLAAARSEANERAERLAEVREQLAQREARLEASTERVAELNHEKDQLIGIRDNLDGERTRLNETVAQLESAKTDLEAQIGSLEGQVDQLRSDLEAREGRINALTESLEEARGKGGQLEEQRLSLSADLARSQEAQARLTDELNHARQEWNENRAELIGERDAVRQRMKELGGELDKIRSARDALERENDKLEETSQQRADSDAATIAELRTAIAEAEEAQRARGEEFEGALERNNLERAGLEAELASTREALDSEQASHEQTRGDLEGAERALGELRTARAQEADEAAANRAALEADLEQRAAELASTGQAAADLQRQLEQELHEARARGDRLETALEAEKAGHSEARQGLGEQVAELQQRLEEATTRAAALASEKTSDGERAKDRIGQLEARIEELGKAIKVKDAALVDARNTHGELEAKVDAVRQEREEVENRYIKELEEVHDDYMRKAQEADTAHSREVEELRGQALEAKRQLKTSQLAAQRLTDRIQKLEERPQRSTAEAAFDSFIAGFKDSDLPIPSAVPNKSPGRRRPTPSSADVPKVPKPAAPPAPSPAVDLADSLSGGAGVPDGEKREDDVTLVGQSPLESPPPVRTAPPRRPTRRPKPAGGDDAKPAVTDDLASDLVADNTTEDFLAAFDDEFKNLKP